MAQSQVNNNWTPASEDLLNRIFPIHRACRDGDIEKLASLLSTGDVDFYEEDDFYGWTPIHWAAYFGKLQCLMHLLEHGSSCDAPTVRLNQTPSHIAAYGGYCHCLKWLLHCGATLNRQDYMGETPMHKAARTGSMECVGLLVSQGAKLSIKNYSDNLPSHVAAAAGYPECATYLERVAMSPVQLQSISGVQPVIHPTCNGSNPMSDGRTSPEGQPSSQNSFISTNTYHSQPHTSINGMINQPHLETGLNNNQLEDCDMEMEEDFHNCNQSTVANTFLPGVQNGDVLLNQGVSQNLVPLAGRKRGREDGEEESFKRARQDDYVFEQRNQQVFALLPFAGSFHDAPRMDCNENVAPSYSNNDIHLNSASKIAENQSEFSKVCDNSHDVDCMGDRGQLGELNQNRAKAYSCLRFKDPPVKCINFMSHYV